VNLGPIFVRRGEVVFLIPDPTIFLNSLQAGKILPTDRLLVKNGSSFEWIPISEVECFDLGSITSQDHDENSAGDKGNLLKRIRVPSFNLSAFFLGGCWYLKNKMLRTGLLKLSLSITLMSLSVFAGIIFELGLNNTIALSTVAWLTMAVQTGLYANRDFNRMLVKTLHTQSQPETGLNDQNIDWQGPLEENALFIAPTLREKVLN